PPNWVRRCDLVRFPNSPALTPLSAASAKCKPPILPRIVSPLMVLPSGKLLHHDAVALDFVQIKLDRCGRLGRCHVGGFDLAKDFTLAAKQDDAPAALHPTGELRWAVFLGAAGRHAANLGGGREESNRNAPRPDSAGAVDSF